MKQDSAPMAGDAVLAPHGPEKAKSTRPQLPRISSRPWTIQEHSESSLHLHLSSSSSQEDSWDRKKRMMSLHPLSMGTDLGDWDSGPSEGSLSFFWSSDPPQWVGNNDKPQ